MSPLKRIYIDNCGCYMVDNGPHDDQPAVYCPAHKLAWRQRIESDLDTLDLEHDQGVKWLTDPFSGEYVL